MTRSESPGITIDLIGCSKDPVFLQYVKTRIAKDGVDAKTVFQDTENENIPKREMLAYLNGLNTLESEPSNGQVKFLFFVRNISRYCSDEIKASFPGVLSQEMVVANLNQPDNQLQSFLPLGGQNSQTQTVMAEWKMLQKKAIKLYQQCLKSGMDQQSANLLLPLGMMNQRFLTFNYQTLQQYLDKMLCPLANWEQQEIAWQLYGIMKEKFPKLSERIGIKCWENRKLFCDESRQNYAKCRWAKERPHQEDFIGLWAKNSFSRPSLPQS